MNALVASVKYHLEMFQDMLALKKFDKAHAELRVRQVLGLSAAEFHKCLIQLRAARFEFGDDEPHDNHHDEPNTGEVGRQNPPEELFSL